MAKGKLMVAQLAKSKGCDFDFLKINLDSMKGFDEAMSKVIKDQKLLDDLPVEVENFNQFPKEILTPKVPEALKLAVEKCLTEGSVTEVPRLSRCGMRLFS